VEIVTDGQVVRARSLPPPAPTTSGSQRRSSATRMPRVERPALPKIDKANE
jgi:hypothetical protein